MLGDKLKDTLRKIIKSPFIDKKEVKGIIKEIQRTLIAGDVNVKIVLDLSKRIENKLLSEKIPKGLTKKEYLIKVLYEELVKLLGNKGYKIKINKKPFKILLLGLFGSGKTTTAVKLAKFFSKRGYKVALVGCDTYRPAAMEQLEQLANKVNLPVFVDKKEKKPEKIIKKFEEKFKKYDIIVVDSAGRDALDKELTREIKKIISVLKPDKKILVLSGDIGQAAKEQAQKFHDSIEITGVIITKLDSTSKGGGALSACTVTGAKVMFIGTGEKIADIEEFDPQKFVSRLLGMGDLESLLNKVKEVIDEDKAEDIAKKFSSGKFNLLDLYKQLEAVKKMGPLNKVLDMIPGLSMAKLPKNAMGLSEETIKKFKVIMNSMTKEELESPQVIGPSRIRRIAKGSGTSEKEVRELLKQYRQMKKLMKQIGGGANLKNMRNVRSLMKKFGIKF